MECRYRPCVGRTQQTGQERSTLLPRARFAAVAAAVKARKSDLNKITTDQQNFAAQKDTAGGKKTMKAYLWKVCGDEYDAAHQG